MRLHRPLAVFAFTAVLAVLAGDVTVFAQTKAKADKQKAKQEAIQKAKQKAMQQAKQKAKNKNRKGAQNANALATPPAIPVKPIQAPAGRKDDAELSRLIDSHIDKKLAEAKVPASPVCSDEEFLRRACLDLTGVIPTEDEARQFLDSKDPKKREKLVDRLLDDPNFGKHLADIWQAKLLPRDSANRFVLREPFIDWLAESFNKNRPWNLFVFDLVSATGTVAENPAVTYFLSNRSVDKITDGVSQHFLGIQLQCAQCHNHPFTDWKQTEYWGMAEFFSKVRPDNPRNGNKGGDNTQIGVQEGAGKTRIRDFFPEAAKEVPAKFLGGSEAKMAATEPYRPILARWMTSPDNPYFAKAMVNRTWALLFGTGFVNPVDDMHDENPASHPELLTGLAKNFSHNGFDVKYLYRAICNSKTYQRTSKPVKGNENDDQLFSHMTVKVMSPEQLYDSLAKVTGPDGRAAAPRPRAAQNPRNRVNQRDTFVQFFLAGAEISNATEYEAGIPQALKLMNSRVLGNPGLVRRFAGPRDEPAEVIEKIYLAALSRRPTREEVSKLKDYVSKAGTANEAYGDILWVVLNSSEFAMVK